jgi:hypothetical protein
MRGAAGDAKRRRQVLLQYFNGSNAQQCADITGHYLDFCQRTISNYIVKCVMDKVRQRRIDLPTFAPEVNPPPFYDNHSEYARHWAGLESEDKRELVDRGKDWPLTSVNE